MKEKITEINSEVEEWRIQYKTDYAILETRFKDRGIWR